MISYRVYDKTEEERDLGIVRSLVSIGLSEPYSKYVYRYFVYDWPQLCFLAFDESTGAAVGTIVCNIQAHRQVRRRGYIAMLAVETAYRGRGIAKTLISRALQALVAHHVDEIVLETEVTNEAALHLYESMGFIRSKRLHRYYLNTNDAYRLILPLTEKACKMSLFMMSDEANLVTL